MGFNPETVGKLEKHISAKSLVVLPTPSVFRSYGQLSNPGCYPWLKFANAFGVYSLANISLLLTLDRLHMV